MENIKSNRYSHFTAKERDFPSFPTKWLLNNGYIKGNVLDFGCGFGKDVDFLKSKGYVIQGYDKYYNPFYPDNQQFDTILCNYVLNVLQTEEQTEVLMACSELLKPGGKIYFSVRRDVIYEGYRMHKLHKRPTFQCNVILPYKSVFKNETCEIYEFQHFNHLSNKSTCPFCSPVKSRNIITESNQVYSIYDKYPVNEGHALIIPKRHTRNYFELNSSEQFEIWEVIKRVKDIITKNFSPDGFNIGFNMEEAGGQTVFHTHIHIIPRYRGDVAIPRGGIRNIIKGKGNY